MKFHSYIYSISAISSTIEYEFSCLITYVSVAFIVNFTEVPLKVAFIVFAIGYYNRLCCNLGYFLTRAVLNLISGIISIKRFEVN
jgi:hypothetical protein